LTLFAEEIPCTAFVGRADRKGTKDLLAAWQYAHTRYTGFRQ
jgi:surfactin synthase thioesterase subunit